MYLRYEQLFVTLFASKLDRPWNISILLIEIDMHRSSTVQVAFMFASNLSFFRTNEDKKLFLYLMKCRRLASFTKNSSCFQLLLRTQIWEGGRILKRRWWRVLSATVQLQFCSPAWSSENIVLLLTKDVVYLFFTGSFRTECETVHIHTFTAHGNRFGTTEPMFVRLIYAIAKFTNYFSDL